MQQMVLVVRSVALWPELELSPGHKRSVSGPHTSRRMPREIVLGFQDVEDRNCSGLVSDGCERHAHGVMCWW